jgi:hypothetical protein
VLALDSETVRVTDLVVSGCTPACTGVAVAGRSSLALLVTDM